MALRKSLLLLMGCLLAVPAARAQQGMTDLIPHRAAAAVAIRNLEDLKKKGDKFFKECELDFGPIRPSWIFAEIYQFLGVKGGVDPEGSAAILLMGPEKDDGNIGLNNLMELLVGVVPVGDLDKLAANFDLEPGSLKPDQITAAKGKNFTNHVLVRGKHIYLANSRNTLKRLMVQKSLAQELSKNEAKAANGADMLIHLGARELGSDWRLFLRDFGKDLPPSDDPEEKKSTAQLIDAISNVRYAFGAIHLDGGLGVNVTAKFDAAHKPSRDFLKSMQPEPGDAGLTGLPEGKVVLAQANHGLGSKTGIFAKALLHHLLLGVFETQHFIAPADRANYVGVFSEVWRHLKGHRAALYLSRDETKTGLFNFLAILDTEDAPKFIADMRVLAKMADGTLDPAEKNPDSKVDFQKLVADLGSDVYRVRESATNRLRLIGEPALPHLEKVLESAELETSRRASRLKLQITTVAAERRKELLSKDAVTRIRPQFVFVPKAETRGNQSIDVVQLKLTGADKALVGQMKQLLGPEWDRIRLAVHGKQVVARFGSEAELLDTALTNLQKGKPGLAESTALTQFHKIAPTNRMVDLHVSVESLLGLITPGENPQALVRPDLSSMSFGLDADRMYLHVFIPYPEVKTMNKKRILFF